MEKEKIKASILLGSYLDTVGYKNGEFEFNHDISNANISNALLISYFHYGNIIMNDLHVYILICK